MKTEEIINLMPFIILAFVCLIIVVIVLILLFRNFSERKGRGETWDSFFLRDGEMVINTLKQRPIYKIEEIDCVRFYCHPGYFKYQGYIGKYRIFQTNGKKSRRFMFNGSVHTRRMQPLYLSGTRTAILKSIEKMRAELHASGICTEYEEYAISRRNNRTILREPLTNIIIALLILIFFTALLVFVLYNALHHTSAFDASAVWFLCTISVASIVFMVIEILNYLFKRTVIEENRLTIHRFGKTATTLCIPKGIEKVELENFCERQGIPVSHITGLPAVDIEELKKIYDEKPWKN